MGRELGEKGRREARVRRAQRTLFVLMAILVGITLGLGWHISFRIPKFTEELGFHGGMALRGASQVQRQVLRTQILVEQYARGRLEEFDEISLAFDLARGYFHTKSLFSLNPEGLAVSLRVKTLLDSYQEALNRLQTASRPDRPQVASWLYALSERIEELLNDLQAQDWQVTERLLGVASREIRTTAAVGGALFALILAIGGVVAAVFRQTLRGMLRDAYQHLDQIEAANKELEAFSYSISHDLRAPLRAINGFSRILLEEHAATLPPEAQRHLQLVVENSQQMGELIDDLLTFSRLSRQPLKKQEVLPARLARQALDDLQSELQGRQVEIRLGDLPPCQGDPALLKQVFVNLLSNALKFTRKREVAVVEIGFQLKNGSGVYFVKDNGVGFDMQYANKLFGVFQRLNPAEEYEGTGVGLAIVQRIIRRHGGGVWAEADVEKGATFYFTL